MILLIIIPRLHIYENMILLPLSFLMLPPILLMVMGLDPLNDMDDNVSFSALSRFSLFLSYLASFPFLPLFPASFPGALFLQHPLLMLVLMLSNAPDSGVATVVASFLIPLLMLGTYQLALLTPSISPLSANLLHSILTFPDITPRLLPVTLHIFLYPIRTSDSPFPVTVFIIFPTTLSISFSTYFALILFSLSIFILFKDSGI